MKIKYNIYTALIVMILGYRMYIGDTDGAILCLLVLPISLYASIMSPND